MASPFLCELRIFSFNYAPHGWAQCNGQLLPINQNQALFALLGTTYGGNGQTTFALPDLRGRTPMHVGGGHTQGETSGELNHTLILSEMPTHSHTVQASNSAPNIQSPSGNFFASNTGFTPYGTPGNISMLATLASSVGGSQPHTNMSPYSVLNICICLTGIFPSRN